MESLIFPPTPQLESTGSSHQLMMWLILELHQKYSLWLSDNRKKMLSGKRTLFFRNEEVMKQHEQLISNLHDAKRKCAAFEQQLENIKNSGDWNDN